MIDEILIESCPYCTCSGILLHTLNSSLYWPEVHGKVQRLQLPMLLWTGEQTVIEVFNISKKRISKILNEFERKIQCYKNMVRSTLILLKT